MLPAGSTPHTPWCTDFRVSLSLFLPTLQTWIPLCLHRMKFFSSCEMDFHGFIFTLWARVHSSCGSCLLLPVYAEVNSSTVGMAAAEPSLTHAWEQILRPTFVGSSGWGCVRGHFYYTLPAIPRRHTISHAFSNFFFSEHG